MRLLCCGTFLSGVIAISISALDARHGLSLKILHPLLETVEALWRSKR
jgi:hypothetical protein